MIRVNDAIVLADDELIWAYIHASGPGGQHVNKASTAVELRFDAARSPSLPAAVRERLLASAGSQMTQEGVLIIDARRYRSQARNRSDALARLLALIREAAREPTPHYRTAVPWATRRERLEDKRRRSRLKRLRRIQEDG
jgi:ribosome-associated protein